MADEIKLKAPTVEQQVVVNISGEEKLKAFSDTLDKISNNKNLQKYWKTQQELINATSEAYGNFQKKTSQDNASELIKIVNALKAVSGTDLSNILPNFDKISKGLIDAQKIVGSIDSAFSVKSFKEAFDSFEALEAYGTDVTKVLQRLGTSADVDELRNQIDDLSESLENAGKKIERLRNINSSLSDELYEVKSGSRVTELEEQLEELRSLKDRTIEEFKQSLGHFGFDEHQFDLDPYIANIEDGVYSAKGALADFKSDYRYLFEDAFNNKQNIGTDQFDKLESSLTEVLKVVQETSAGIKELQNQIDMFSVPGIEDDFKGSDESLKQIINLFGQINNSLSSLRSIISDVGDGEEFSPLLKTIKEITTAVDTLSKSVSNIGLNVNIESGGMDQKLLSSLDAKKQSLLSAYKTQFDAMRAFKPSGATVAMANPENRSRIAALNKQINNFDGGASTDNIDQRITAYKEIIKLMKEVSQLSYGKDIYSDMDSSFKNAVSSATGQATRVQNELKKANTDGAGLENLFGSQDLSKVVEQLGRIADQFENIAKAASEFKVKFADGIKVESSVQEVETLTKKIKELEEEINKLKAYPETNISTPKNTTPDTAGASADDSKVSIEGEGKAADEAGKSFNKASQAKQEFVDVNKKVKQSAESSADAVKKEAEAVKQVDFTPNTEGFDEIVAKFKDFQNYRDQIEKITKISNRNKDGKYDVSYNAKLKSGSSISVGENSAPQVLRANEVVFDAKEKNQEEVKARQEVVDQMRITEADYIVEKERLLNEGKKQAEQVAEQEASERKAIVEKMQLDESDYINERERLLNEGKKQAEEIANQEAVERKKAVDEMRLVEANYLDEREKLLNEGKHQAEEAAQEELKARQNIVTQMQIDEANYFAERERLLDEGAKQAEDVANQEAAEREEVLNQMRLEEADYVNERERLLKEGEQQAEEIAKQEAEERQAVVERMQIDEANYLNEREKLLNEGKLQAEQAAQEEVKARQEAVDQMQLAEADYIAERERLLKEGKQQEKDSYKSDTQTRLDSLRNKFGDTEIGSSRFDQMFPNIENQIEKLNKSLDRGSISIDEYEKKVDELLGKKVSNSISDSMAQAINEQKSQLKEATTEMQKVIDDTANKIKTGKPVDGMRSSDYSTMMDKYKAELEELRILQATVSKQDYVSAAQLKQFDDLRKKLKDSETSFKTLSAAEKGSDSLSRAKLYSKIGEYLQKNSGMTKEFKTQLKSLQKQLENDGPNANVKNLTDQFIRLQSQIREAGQEGRSFLDVLKDKAFYGFAGQLSTYFGFNDFVRYIGEGVNTIRELDTAMTEMRKVSDESVVSLKNYQKATFDVADAVGTTAIQIQNSTADWQRLGYGLDEASKLAEISNLYKNVGDMDINEATEHMISSVQAWKSEFSSTVDTAEAIANRYNKIGNEFAISSADIGEAMETSAAALKAGGNTLNESLGLITAGNVIQQDASTVSSAMKILSLRIRGAKADLESMGESTDDLADSTSKLRDELKALTGVDIMLDENTFKSTAQIIQEIGKNWSKMTDVSQAAALEKLAGKNRASTVAGLIENYETIGKVIEAAEQADNSALEENEKFLESIDGRVQKLQNRMQEFWATVIDTDTVKTGISLLTDLVSGATALVDKLGTLPTALGALGAALSVKNVGGRKMFRLLNMPTA